MPARQRPKGQLWSDYTSGEMGGWLTGEGKDGPRLICDNGC